MPRKAKVEKEEPDIIEAQIEGQEKPVVPVGINISKGIHNSYYL